MSEPAFRTGVVAIGRDEGERLKRCLRSLQNVRGPVTYVDSASTDGSAEEARALGAQVVPLDVTQPFTAARARAAGVAALERDYRRLVRRFERYCGFAAWLSIADKYAELTGIIRYAVRAIGGRSGSTVHYK